MNNAQNALSIHSLHNIIILYKLTYQISRKNKVKNRLLRI